MSIFKTKFSKIDEKTPTYIIAEVAQAHDGSIGSAHSFIDALKKTGVNAVKFQSHIAEYESTYDEKFRVKFSSQDKTRYDYWKRMELSIDHLKDLKLHCESEGIDFLCSPFSLESIRLLEQINVHAYKIGSAEANWDEFISKIISIGKPFFISFGLSQADEINKLIKKFKKLKSSFCPMLCYSEYPTPLKKINLGHLKFLRDQSSLVGYSDHSGQIWPSIFALSQGINALEVHVKLSEFAFGPDASSSLLPEQINQICSARDKFYELRNQISINKESSFKNSHTRKLFSRSIALRENYQAGTKITKDMIIAKKPGTGIPLNNADRVVGKALIKNYDSKFY